MNRVLQLLGKGAGPRREDATPALDRLAALARTAAAGNRAALRTLIALVTPALLRAVRGVLGARHPDVEDVVQEAALAIVQALPGFRFESTVLHFGCRVAVFTALAARRRLKVRGEGLHDELELDVHDHDQPRPDEQLAGARRRMLLRGLCEDLPDPQAEALLLHVMLGFTVEEVADAAQVPANTVRSRLRLAKDALRARIASDVRLQELMEVLA